MMLNEYSNLILPKDFTDLLINKFVTSNLPNTSFRKGSKPRIFLRDFANIFYKLLYFNELISLTSDQEMELARFAFIKAKLLGSDLSQFFNDLKSYSPITNTDIQRYVEIFSGFKEKDIKEVLTELINRDDLLYVIFMQGMIVKDMSVEFEFMLDNGNYRNTRINCATALEMLLSKLKKICQKQDNLSQFYRIINYESVLNYYRDPQLLNDDCKTIMHSYGAQTNTMYSLSNFETYMAATMTFYANYCFTLFFEEPYIAYLSDLIFLHSIDRSENGPKLSDLLFMACAMLKMFIGGITPLCLLAAYFSDEWSTIKFRNPIPTIITTLVLPSLVHTDILYRAAEFTKTEVAYYKVSEFAQSCLEKFLNPKKTFLELIYGSDTENAQTLTRE